MDAIKLRQAQIDRLRKANKAAIEVERAKEMMNQAMAKALHGGCSLKEVGEVVGLDWRTVARRIKHARIDDEPLPGMDSMECPICREMIEEHTPQQVNECAVVKARRERGA